MPKIQVNIRLDSVSHQQIKSKYDNVTAYVTEAVEQRLRNDNSVDEAISKFIKVSECERQKTENMLLSTKQEHICNNCKYYNAIPKILQHIQPISNALLNNLLATSTQVNNNRWYTIHNIMISMAILAIFIYIAVR